VIDDYRFGRIRIDGRTYDSDVIIYGDRVDADWWRKEGHVLSLDDLEGALAAEPEVLVVGTGAHGVMRVSDEVKERLRELRVELHVAPTDEACRTYNALAPTKVVVAALHLTC